MNGHEDPLRVRFQRQRTRDESYAPSFAAMSVRARIVEASAKPTPRRTILLWLAPAAAVVVMAAFSWRPHPADPHEYSDRIAALIAKLDEPTFAQADVPSDLLPSAFPRP